MELFRRAKPRLCARREGEVHNNVAGIEAVLSAVAPPQRGLLLGYFFLFGL
jgi:hypothetical protein